MAEVAKVVVVALEERVIQEQVMVVCQHFVKFTHTMHYEPCGHYKI